MPHARSSRLRIALTSLLSVLFTTKTGMDSRRGRWFPKWAAADLAIALGGVFCFIFCSSAMAQTAHFSGAQITLGGGFSAPRGVAVDGSGNVYVADSANNAVKEIPAGCFNSLCVVTLGGSYAFSSPKGIGVNSSGNVFVADTSNNKVVEMTPNCFDSSCVTQLGGSYGFSTPTAVAIDGSGNVFVADFDNGLVEKMTPGCVISTCVTSIGSGFTNPDAVAVDGSDNVFVTDNGTSKVYEITSASSYTTTTQLAAGFTFASLRGVALDASGNLYIADSTLNAVEKVTFASGYNTVVTLASNYNAPRGVAVDSNGNIYIGDYGNNAVEEVKTSNVSFGPVNVGSTGSAILLLFTFDTGGTIGAPVVLTQGAAGLDFADAGTGTCAVSTPHILGDTCTVNVTFTPAFAGTRYGAALLEDESGNILATAYIYGVGIGPQVNFLPGIQSTVASVGLTWPFGVTVDGSGNVYIADTGNNRVLKETLSGGSYIESTVALSGLANPEGVAVDGSGNIYIADTGNSRVLKETPSGSGYTESLVASSGLSSSGGVAVDGSGNVYIADTGNSRVLKESLSGSSYIESVVASSGLLQPDGVAVDGSGNVYIADTVNRRVLKETLSGGIYAESTVASSGLYNPYGVAVDGNGNVYIADTLNWRVLKETLSGGIYTESPIGSGLTNPEGVAVDGSGNIYLTDSGNNRVLKQNFTDAPSLNFNSTDVSTISSDSPQQITVLNIGNATLNAAGPGLTVPVDFTQVAGSGTPPDCASSFSLLPNASCNLSIDFAPTQPGLLSELLVLTDNALNVPSATQSITLNGTGNKITPVITWAAPPAITYGTALSATQLNASSGGVAGTFVYTPPVGTVLSAGVGQALSVTFTPSVPADYNSASGSTTITVDKATPVITWAAPSAITYGTALSATQLNATSGGVAGTFVYTPPVGTVLNAGVGQTLSVTFTPSVPADYNSASGSTTITVDKATPVITLTSTVSTLVAKTPVTFTATVSSSLGTPSGSVNFYDGTTLLGPGTLTLGVATYTTSNLAGGTHSITAAYGGNINFSALTSAAITEIVEDFAVTTPSGSSATATVAPGGIASYTLRIAPSGNTTFPSAITLAVSGLPVGATATITPQTLAAGAGATNVVLAVQVPIQTASLQHSDRIALQLSPLMMGMLLIPFAGRLRRFSLKGRSQQLKKWLSVVLLVIVVAASLVGLAGCGARSSGFPVLTSQTYSLTITATSGSLSHSTTVTLIVEHQ